MDFAKPLIETASVASKSNIRHVQLSDGAEETLDQMHLRAANKAALEMIYGPTGDKEQIAESSITTSGYTDRLLPVQQEIREGDLVVILESFDNLDFT